VFTDAETDAFQPQKTNEEELELFAAAGVGATAVVRLLAASTDAAAFCLGHGTGAYQRLAAAPVADDPPPIGWMAVAGTSSG